MILFSFRSDFCAGAHSTTATIEFNLRELKT